MRTSKPIAFLRIFGRSAWTAERLRIFSVLRQEPRHYGEALDYCLMNLLCSSMLGAYAHWALSLMAAPSVAQPGQLPSGRKSA